MNNYCPCCSGLLLAHLRSSEIVWFCRHCWQEMPVSTGQRSSFITQVMVEKLPKHSQIKIEQKLIPYSTVVSTKR